MKRTMMLLAIGLTAIVCAACLSPLDPVTPRLRYADNPPLGKTLIHAKAISITARNKQGDSVIWHTSIRDTLVLIDTSISPPVLWFHAGVIRNDKMSATPFIQEFWFNADSILTNGTAYPLARDSMITPLAGFVLSYARNGNLDSQLVRIPAVPGKASGYLIMHAAEKNRITGQFSGSVATYQLTVFAEIVIEY